MASIVSRRFGEEIASLMGRKVSVETTDGRTYQGDLTVIDDRMNMVLDNPVGVGENVFRIVLNGEYVKEVRLIERPFDLRALADRLGRVFPGLVRLREDVGAIMVMEKIKVTKEGVVEGTGLAAERAKAVFEEFIKDRTR